MKLTCVKRREDLPFFADWNRLANGSPFRSWEWLSSWWETYGSDVEIMAPLVHSDDGELVAIAPWYIDISRTRGRVIKTFGDGKACSDYTGILVDPSHADEAIATIGEWLQQSGTGRLGATFNWDALEFDGVAESEATTVRLLEHVCPNSRFEKASSMHTWTVSLPGSWDEYLAARSKRRRNVLRRMARQFIESGRATVKFASSKDEVDEFFVSLVSLHTQRRKELGCGGCFSFDRFDEFLRLAANRLFDSDKLWLSQVWIDGEVAANSLGIRESDAVYLYQCGFASKFESLKPGWIQNILNLQQAVELEIRRFDFLRGDEAYKSQLGGEPTELFRYRGAAPSLVSRVRHDLSSLAKTAFRSLPIDLAN